MTDPAASTIERDFTTGFCDACVADSHADSPGNVNTNNGIGRKFYGNAERCAACDSSIRTLWWVLADIPMRPLGSYRYKAIEPEQHSGFFVQSTSHGFIARRTRTHWNQVLTTWVAGFAGAAALAFVIWWFQWRRVVPSVALIAFLASAPAASAQGDVTLAAARVTSLQGRITTSHSRSNHGHHDNSYHQHYLIQGVAGDTLMATATSRDWFPVAIAIYGPESSGFLVDDGGTNGNVYWYARARTRLPVTGQYVICAHTHMGIVTGNFSLSVQTLPGSGYASAPTTTPDAQQPGGPPITRDFPVTGMLTTSHPVSANSYHQHYTYQGVAGELVTVRAWSPGPFKVAVALYPPGADARSLADHGGRPDYDPSDDETAWLASVEARLPFTGQYEVCIHSHENMTVGAYELMLTSR